MSERIGRYEIVRLLAVGGTGELFLARADSGTALARDVVVKRILRHLAAEPSFVNMFLNEARLAAPLSHPNIIRIFELGEDKGTYFLVMEYVHGLSLHAIQRQLQAQGKRLSPRLASYVCAQALHGLHYAHTLKDAQGRPAGIVHRDVTPDNLLVAFNGTVKVADFGIAKGTLNAPTTAAGTVKGKFAYMSPEQINGQHLDGRADVFSMGVVLYLLLSGQLPFDGPSDGAILSAVLHRQPVDVRDISPEVSPALAEVVAKALAKDKEKRYPTAQAMAFALEAILARDSERVSPVLLSTFLRSNLPDPAQAGAQAEEATSPGSSDASERPTLVEGPSSIKKEPRPTPIPGPQPATRPAPPSAVLIAQVERPPVPDADKRTRVPMSDRVSAFQPLMSPEVTREFEHEFRVALGQEEYSPLEANRAIDFLSARCLPQMQLSQGRRWAGRGFLLRYRMSILGRVLLAAMPFLGVERLVQRSPREFAATTNYGTRRVYRLGPGLVRYDFEDELTYPEFIEGILWAGGEVSHAAQLDIRYQRKGTHAFSFELSWG